MHCLQFTQHHKESDIGTKPEGLQDKTHNTCTTGITTLVTDVVVYENLSTLVR